MGNIPPKLALGSDSNIQSFMEEEANHLTNNRRNNINTNNVNNNSGNTTPAFRRHSAHTTTPSNNNGNNNQMIKARAQQYHSPNVLFIRNNNEENVSSLGNRNGVNMDINPLLSSSLSPPNEVINEIVGGDIKTFSNQQQSIPITKITNNDEDEDVDISLSPIPISIPELQIKEQCVENKNATFLLTKPSTSSTFPPNNITSNTTPIINNNVEDDDIDIQFGSEIIQLQPNNKILNDSTTTKNSVINHHIPYTFYQQQIQQQQPQSLLKKEETIITDTNNNINNNTNNKEFVNSLFIDSFDGITFGEDDDEINTLGNKKDYKDEDVDIIIDDFQEEEEEKNNININSNGSDTTSSDYDLIGLSSSFLTNNQNNHIPAPTITVETNYQTLLPNSSFTYYFEWKINDIIKDTTRTKSFQLIEQLGEGSFGTVWKVIALNNNYNNSYNTTTSNFNNNYFDNYFDNYFALKMITVNDYQEKEVKLMMMLDHENIVKYYDSFMDSDRRYYCILMEYCNGQNLDVFLKDLSEITITLNNNNNEDNNCNNIDNNNQSFKYLTMDILFSWFLKLLDVLNYLHQHKVIHRDLKPQNIIVKYDKKRLQQDFENEIKNITMKIIDFGLAKQLTNQKLTSTIVGTRAYLAPEMIPGKQYSFKVDIYSLGIIFMQVSCGLSARDFQELIANYAQRYNINFWNFIKTNKFFEFIYDNILDIGCKRIVKLMVCKENERKTAFELLNHPIIKTWKYVFNYNNINFKEILKEEEEESFLGYLSGIDHRSSNLCVEKAMDGMKRLINDKPMKICQLIYNHKVLPILIFYVSRRMLYNMNEYYLLNSLFIMSLDIIYIVLNYYDLQKDKFFIKDIIKDIKIVNDKNIYINNYNELIPTTCILNFLQYKIINDITILKNIVILKIIYFLCKYDKNIRNYYYNFFLVDQHTFINCNEENLNTIDYIYNYIFTTEKQKYIFHKILTYLYLQEKDYKTLLNNNFIIHPNDFTIFNEIPFHLRRFYILNITNKFKYLLNSLQQRNNVDGIDKLLQVLKYFIYDYFHLEKYTTFTKISNLKFKYLTNNDLLIGLPNNNYYFYLKKIYDRQSIIRLLQNNNINNNISLKFSIPLINNDYKNDNESQQNIKTMYFEEPQKVDDSLLKNEEFIETYLFNYQPIILDIDYILFKNENYFSHLQKYNNNQIIYLDKNILQFQSRSFKKLNLITSVPIIHLQEPLYDYNNNLLNNNNFKESTKTIFYFEIKLKNIISSKINIGYLGKINYDYNNLNCNSSGFDKKITYSLHEGNIFSQHENKKEILFKDLNIYSNDINDIIGCGLTDEGQVYFTKNGIFLFDCKVQRLYNCLIYPFIEIIISPFENLIIEFNFNNFEKFKFKHKMFMFSEKDFYFEETLNLLNTAVQLKQLPSSDTVKFLKKSLKLHLK
ncbi:hypothetical protein ABK040_005214 [Willaertia magna]